LLRVIPGQGTRTKEKEKHILKEQYKKIILLRWYFEEKKYKGYELRLWSGVNVDGKAYQINNLERLVKQVRYTLSMMGDAQAHEDVKKLGEIDADHLLMEAQKAFQEAGILEKDLQRGVISGPREKKAISRREIQYIFRQSSEKMEDEEQQNDAGEKCGEESVGQIEQRESASDSGEFELMSEGKQDTRGSKQKAEKSPPIVASKDLYFALSNSPRGEESKKGQGENVQEKSLQSKIFDSIEEIVAEEVLEGKDVQLVRNTQLASLSPDHRQLYLAEQKRRMQ